MSADLLLSKLTKTRKTGPGSWIACCPAHEDKNPSMTIREVEDGRVLVHCFTGCDTESVLGAVGLEFDALFPPKPLGDRVVPLRRPFPAVDVLEAVAHEALVVHLIARSIATTGNITEDQRRRLFKAVTRIHEARDLVHG